MKSSLKPGLKHTFSFPIGVEKTVPALYPESEEFRAMPEVFATGYMVGLLEWGCIRLLAPHLDAGEGSLGVHVDCSHTAATPPGMTVTVDAELVALDGRKAWFSVRAHDGVDMITEGRHQRAIVTWDKFKTRVADKARSANQGQNFDA